MSCSRNWNGLFNDKLRQRLTECLDRNARTEPICVDVIVKDWNNASSEGTFRDQGADTGLDEGPARVVRDEQINESKVWKKRRREKEEGVGRTRIIPATDVCAQRAVQQGLKFEKFYWNLQAVRQMIEAVQSSIRELETMQRGDARYGVKAPISTKLVAVYLDNSCLYQIVCTSIVAMGYAFVPLHRQWSRNVISEVIEACGVMTVFWSRPGSCCKPESRRVPGGLGLPTCAERSKGLKQIWYSELKCIDASSGKLIVEHTCRHDAEERDSQRMQHAEVLRQWSPDASSTSDMVPTAYIIRTSGTTKGPENQGRYVVGTIPGILNRIKWFEMEHPSSAGNSLTTTDRDVLGFLTPNCFVDHVWQTFASLCSDVQTVTIPLGLYMDDYLLLRAIKEFRISHLVLTPSKWQRLVNASCCVHDSFGSVKVAISSGELLSIHLLKQLKSVLHPRCKILNIYGSTEVSADATCFDCSNLCAVDEPLCGAHAWVPVGKPIYNTIAALSMQFKTDDRMEDRYSQSISGDKKQVGMIWCGGIGVCNGYLDLSNNKERERSKFVLFRDFKELQAHFDDTIQGKVDFPAERTQTPEESSIWMFCTGDLGFINDCGDLVVIGRADMTTKVGGHFIQIEEIENMLESIQGIVRAFATVVEVEGRRIVAACVVQDGSNHVSQSQIQCMCRQRVDMMNCIPECIFELENLPLTCSGKLDRNLLQKIAMEKIEKQRKLHFVVPVDAILTEREVHAIVAKCLHIAAFEPTESLFDLGANSIAIQKIASLLNLSPNQVIDHPTVRRLTKVRENREALPGQMNRQQRSDVNFNRQKKIPLLWKFDSDSCIDVPPCVSGSTVFCCSHKGLVAALHVEDGHVLWTRSLNGTFAGKLGASDSLLVVPGETEVVCLSALNGNTIWKKSGLCVASQSGAYFDEHENIWICTHNLGLVVLSATTGETVARHSVDGAVSSSTYYPPDIELPDGTRRMCFAATLKGNALGLMYHYESQTTVPVIVTKWAHSLHDPIFATPVLVDSTRILYLSVKGAVHCFDAISGQVLFKTNEANDGHHYFVSPIQLRDNRPDTYILIASQQGKLTVLDMHSQHLGIESVPVARFGSTLLQIASVPGPLQVHSNTLLCTLDSGDLCSLELVLCDKKWRAKNCSIRHSFDSTQSHALCIDCNGHVFAGTRDNTLYAFLYSSSC